MMTTNTSDLLSLSSSQPPLRGLRSAVIIPTVTSRAAAAVDDNWMTKGQNVMNVSGTTSGDYYHQEQEQQQNISSTVNMLTDLMVRNLTQAMGSALRLVYSTLAKKSLSLPPQHLSPSPVMSLPPVTTQNSEVPSQSSLSSDFSSFTTTVTSASSVTDHPIWADGDPRDDLSNSLEDLQEAGSAEELTYGLDDEYSLHIEASKQLWDLVQRDETVVLVIFLSIVTCVGIVALVVSKFILRRRRTQYQLIPNQDPNHRFNYIYRPIHGNAALDDEYENTFVGVSIPILQDNTRI